MAASFSKPENDVELENCIALFCAIQLIFFHMALVMCCNWSIVEIAIKQAWLDSYSL